MPGANLYGWEPVSGKWLKLICNDEGKLIIDPSEIFEVDPTEDEHGKAPDSSWAFDHKADEDAHHTPPVAGDFAHNDLDGIGVDDHHAKYTDLEAAAAAAVLLAIHAALPTVHQDAPALVAAHVIAAAAHAQYLSNVYLNVRELTDADDADTKGLTAYLLLDGSDHSPPGNNHALFTLSHSAAWSVQLAGDWRTNEWYVRVQTNTTWGSWRKIWHEGNLTLYTDADALAAIAAYDVTPSDKLQHEALTERYNTTTTPIKVKEFTMERNGSVKLVWSLKTTDRNWWAFARICRNGVAVGALKSTRSITYVSVTDTVAGWTAGDKLQLYIWCQSAMWSCWLKDFRVYFNDLLTCSLDLD